MNVTPELSRQTKIIVETGSAGFREAERFLRSLTLDVRLPQSGKPIQAAQAAALTAIAVGSRTFVGGVSLSGAVDQKLILPLPFHTLGEAAQAFGAVRVAEPSRTILIGPSQAVSGWTVRAWWKAWLAVVRPEEDEEPCGPGDNPLSGIAAGAISVSRAFLAARGDLRAGRIAESISLWNPQSSEDVGESPVYLPKALWLLGIGNLGQAYLWSFSLLPFQRPHEVSLLLQDFDTVKPENWGTSVLARKDSYGLLKTRLAEDWLLARGFAVSRWDRRFDGSTRRDPSEPPYALSGLDKMKYRRLLGNPGFDFVIDAGLGAKAIEYDTFRVNVFEETYDAGKHFAGLDDIDEETQAQNNLRLPGYATELETDPADQCGLAEIAGSAAAAPFVSAFVGTLAVTQAIRLASGQAFHRTIGGSVSDIRTVRTTKGPKGCKGFGVYSERFDC